MVPDTHQTRGQIWSPEVTRVVPLGVQSCSRIAPVERCSMRCGRWTCRCDFVRIKAWEPGRALPARLPEKRPVKQDALVVVLELVDICWSLPGLLAAQTLPVHQDLYPLAGF